MHLLCMPSPCIMQQCFIFRFWHFRVKFLKYECGLVRERNSTLWFNIISSICDAQWVLGFILLPCEILVHTFPWTTSSISDLHRHLLHFAKWCSTTPRECDRTCCTQCDECTEINSQKTVKARDLTHTHTHTQQNLFRGERYSIKHCLSQSIKPLQEKHEVH